MGIIKSARRLGGLKIVRRFLEPYWVVSYVRHPLWSRLWVGYEKNYIWFSQFAKILEEARKIPGSEGVIRRLGIPQEYVNALSEIDFGLRIYLGQLDCRFVSRGENPTPDLVFEHNGQISTVEISSLNSSEQDRIEIDT